MPSQVKLDVIEGQMKGTSFSIEEHDTFIIGREADCHACLDEDTKVSRHHFILEANPPEARIRDLGSRNGTHVRHGAQGAWEEIGRRKREENPEEGARRRYKDVSLRDGDQVQVGQTVIHVSLTAVASCAECQADAAENPAELLYLMLRQAGLIAEGKAKPEVPGYEIGNVIGKGGFGCVYLARRLSDGRQVAIKVMLSKVAVNEKVRNDFRREIEVTRALKSHPHIVTLLDHGTAGTGFYFVMEYYSQGSMAELMKRRGGRVALAEAAPIMLQALDGLIYMHDEKFVHRDLKPDNILLEKQGGALKARISDLGLSKNFEMAGLSGCTVTGQYAGTYCFMPREQLTKFKYIQPVSDIWSMGATFYNMLTGALPHDFPRGQDQANIVLNNDIVPIRRRDPSLPKSLAETIDRSLAKNINDRYQSAREMRSAIESAL